MPFIQFKTMLRNIIERQIEQEAADTAYNAGYRSGHDENKGLENNPYSEYSELKAAWRKGLLHGIINKTVEKKSR